ncbi:hypothetical protein HPS26_18965 [Klebsiella aerogenes]|uniref:hypothetical protein n=1 Tax=Klebsiella aerogenes TaxID=548 RepID=UPI0014952028|nr:hypothetical protein [Klebsiella aerogenes]NPD52089.1 hypothetical protein [Klebsiella aerogenes]NPD79262.1 hypothetical protein [Klebsiella aerogenes]
MKAYNMMDDFRFLYPRKSDMHKNIRRDRGHLNMLVNTWCLFYNDSVREKAIDLITELNYYYEGITDGEIMFSDECSPEYKEQIIAVTRQCIYKKMSAYRRLRDYHHEVLRSHPKAGYVCFSLDVDKNTHNYLTTDVHNNLIKDLVKKFTNNFKSLTLYSHVAAYFWVILRRRDGYPYLHFTLYFKEKDFNHVVGLSINKTWLNVLEKQGLKGSIRYFIITEDFIGPRLSKGGVAGDRCLYEVSPYHDDEKNELFIYNDYNGAGILQEMSSDINKINKKVFELHLYTLSKLTFVFPGKTKSQGFSKIKK